MFFCEREHKGNGGVRKSVKLKEDWGALLSFVVIRGHS